MISGSGTLTQSGTGTTTLAGANSYGGTTTITGGTLSISADNNLGADPVNAALAIVLSGSTLKATASFTLNSNRGIVLGPTSGSGGGAIDVTNGNNLTFSGALTNNGSGTGSLTVTDAGTLTIDYTANGAPGGAYSGGTTVNGGANLILKDTYSTYGHNNGNSFIGTGALVVTNATVSVQTTNPFGYSPVAPITLNAGGVMTMTDNMAANLASLTLNGGTLASSANPSSFYGSWLLDQDVTVGGGTSTISAMAVNWSGNRTFAVNGILNVTGTFTGIQQCFGRFQPGQSRQRPDDIEQQQHLHRHDHYHRRHAASHRQHRQQRHHGGQPRQLRRHGRQHQRQRARLLAANAPDRQRHHGRHPDHQLQHRRWRRRSGDQCRQPQRYRSGRQLPLP